MMPFLIPEINIIIIFASDAEEWDRCLTDCFAQMIKYPLNMSHKRIEDIQYPISKSFSHSLSKSDAILVILSQDFKDLIYILNEKIFQLSKLFNPSKTILMFCGISEKNLTEIHKSVLNNYNLCHRLIARDSEKQFVINVIKCLLYVLKLNKYDSICINEKNMISSSPQFELSSEDIFEAKEKVYILLEAPISENERIHLTIGVSNEILMVHWKNPYTLYFTIPAFMVTYNEYLNVSLICGHKFLGTRKIRCLKLNVDNNNNFCNESSNNESFYYTKMLDPLKNNNIMVKKIHINDQDFYLKPQINFKINKFRRNTEFDMKINTNTTNKTEFYSIYDIPRSASLTAINDDLRQVFV